MGEYSPINLVRRQIKKWITYEAPPWFKDQDVNATVVYHGVCRRCKAAAESDGIATYYGSQVSTLHEAPAPSTWYGRMEPWFQKADGRTFARRVKWQDDHRRLWRIDTVIKMDYETWLWTHDHRRRDQTEPPTHSGDKWIPNARGTGGP